MTHTLEVFYKKTLIFSSNGNWLYPLFELEHFLAGHDDDPKALVAYDKIVGKAAALLWARLGIGYLNAGILSRPGRDALERHKVRYCYEGLVDRIACQTEEILIDEFDPEAAYAILKKRAEAVRRKEEKTA